VRRRGASPASTRRSPTSISPLPERRPRRRWGSGYAGGGSVSSWSAPRLRARRTAELAGVTDAVTDDELVEWDYGDYEGLTTDQIRETAPGWTVFSSPCPNGETASQVGARADRVLARVAAAAVEDALLIGHGHALRVLAARWLRQPAAFGAHLELAVSTLSNLGWERETPTVETWNA